MLPGIAYYLSRWYTKDELAFRLALYIGKLASSLLFCAPLIMPPFVVCAPLAGAFGGTCRFFQEPRLQLTSCPVDRASR
jgi:hypothetical protein